MKARQRQTHAGAQATKASALPTTTTAGSNNSGAAKSNLLVGAGAGGVRRLTNPSISPSPPDRAGAAGVSLTAVPPNRPSSAPPPLQVNVAVDAPPTPPPPTARVQAAVRVRPLVDFEKAAGPACAEVLRVVTAAGRLTRPMKSAFVLEVLPSTTCARRGRVVSPPIASAAPAAAAGGPAKVYAFDCCAGPAVTQAEFFDLLEMPALCEAALAGEVVTVFCFGQTGSGKTYTLSGQTLAASEAGPMEEPPPLVAEDGLQYRAVEYVARRLKGLRRSSRQAHHKKDRRRHDSTDGGDAEGTTSPMLAAAATTTSITAKCSYVELYQETLYDLLQPDGGDNVRCRWSAAAASFFVEGSLMVECRRHDDFLLVLREGQRNRQRGSHALNHDSSRSHVVFTIFFESHDGVAGGGDHGDASGGVTDAAAVSSTRYGRLVFVDLAGSERLKKTQSTSNAETGSINKSLFMLGRVLELLSTPSADESCADGDADAAGAGGGGVSAPPFIPYRSSVLTQLLMHSLDGHGRTVMVACVSPSVMHLEESLRTIHYAERARHIRAVPVVHVDAATQQRMALEGRVRELQKENALLRRVLGLPRGGALQEAEVLAHVAAMQHERRASVAAAPLGGPAHTASPLPCSPTALPPSRGAATTAMPLPSVPPQARQAVHQQQVRRVMQAAQRGAAAVRVAPQDARPPSQPLSRASAPAAAMAVRSAEADEFDAAAAQTVLMSSSSSSFTGAEGGGDGDGDGGDGSVEAGVRGSGTAPVPAKGGGANIMALLDALPDTRFLHR